MPHNPAVALLKSDLSGHCHRDISEVSHGQGSFFSGANMGRDPAVLFYTSDFRSATMAFTDEQCGQYIRLLCDQHQIGHLPKQHMLNICHNICNPVMSKFREDEQGLFFNERMDSEIKKRSTYCESRRKNRLHKEEEKVGEKHMSQHMSDHMSRHMGNGNSIKDILDVKNNNSIVVLSPLDQAMADFAEMRSRIRKPMTDRARVLTLKKLEEIAPNDTSAQIKILEQSIANSWQGVFPLGGDRGQTRRINLNRGATMEEIVAQAQRVILS